MRPDESLLQLVLDSLSIPLVVLDGRGAVVFASRGWEQVFTVRDARRARRGIRGVLEGGLADFEMEYDSALPGEPPRRWRLRASPLPPPHGGAIVAHVDVTGRVHAELELRRLRERYELATLAGRVGVWDVELRSGAVFVDSAFKTELGYAAGEVADHPEEWERLIHVDDLPWVRERFFSHLRGEEPVFDVEFRLLASDGSVRQVHSRGEARRRADGKPYRIVGTVTDVTARREAEEVAALQAWKYQAIFEGAGVALWECDYSGVREMVDRLRNEGVTDFRAHLRSRPWLVREAAAAVRVLDVNRRAVRLLGGSSKEDLLRPHPEELTPEAEEELIEQVAAIAEGRSEFEGEAIIRSRRGEERHILAYMVFPRPDDPFHTVLKSAVDITDRRRAREALRESEEALRVSNAEIRDLAGRLIAAQEEERSRVARELHDDLTQRLAGLSIGLSQLRGLVEAGRESALPFLAHLQEQIVGLAEGIRRISQRMHPAVLDHAGLLVALRAYCGEFGAQRGMRVRLDAPPSVRPLPSEVALCVYRVAQEALTNAARYSRAPEVQVRVETREGELRLTVRDAGVGFDPDAARVRGGLGLVSMAERARLVDGTLEVDSAPGAGTEIRLWVPIRGGGG